MVRRAIESLYKGRCTIVQLGQETLDPETKVTTFEDVVLCEDEPCRVSYQLKQSAKESDTVSKVVQSIKLFLRPDLEVLAGSVVLVTQNGRTRKYIASGLASVYSNHQEIILEIGDDKA